MALFFSLAVVEFQANKNLFAGSKLLSKIWEQEFAHLTTNERQQKPVRSFLFSSSPSLMKQAGRQAGRQATWIGANTHSGLIRVLVALELSRSSFPSHLQPAAELPLLRSSDQVCVYFLSASKPVVVVVVVVVAELCSKCFRLSSKFSSSWALRVRWLDALLCTRLTLNDDNDDDDAEAGAEAEAEKNGRH